MAISRTQTTTLRHEKGGDVMDENDKLGLDSAETFVGRDYKINGHPWPYRAKGIILFTLLHIGAVIGVCCLHQIKLLTWIFGCVLHVFCQISITAGNHRLWAHRTYKAKLPLRIVLMIGQTTTVQNDIFKWALDHRVHHKYTDTDADPHNAKRGFFFSHIGWLLLNKLPEFNEKSKNIDVSDLLADPVVTFQLRYYTALCTMFGFVMPALVPWGLWGEDFLAAFFTAGILRCVIGHHTTFLVNSAAHAWGNKPYDIRIDPGENIAVSVLTTGEGFHNFHHVFPQDYRTSEHGWRFNLSTAFIDTMSAIGQVTDRRYVSDDVIRRRQKRTGNLMTSSK
ncbi:acyl-CoA desaturase-like [Mizuhopecten yessoensis]|uniref:acyl-CoA desaturase-like n=1 Tax=Mizuhopecten yessoensis TaxID=6573 RepID=UPI000B45CDAB|nr:acyl-CoA desaturase-like [Mizuhopecten yessoensis]